MRAGGICYDVIVKSTRSYRPNGWWAGVDAMAVEKWVTVGAKHCELIDLDVEMRERRVYPTSDFLHTQGNEHRVRGCVCTAAIQCNLAGIPCQWAFSSPGNDRF